MIGAKIAGIKIKVPVFLIDDSRNISSLDSHRFIRNMSIVGSFLFATYGLKRISMYMEKKKLRSWIEHDLV